MLSFTTIATLLAGASAFAPPAGRVLAAAPMHASSRIRPSSPSMVAPMLPTTTQLAELVYDSVSKATVQQGTDGDILLLGVLAIAVPVVVTVLGVGSMGQD